MGEDERRKAFLKGYEEGLRAAWREIGSLTTRGLCITRIHPDDLRSRYPIEGAGFIWLSKSAGGPAKDMAVAEPCALVDIASAISDFASDGGNAAVLLEGLEYMISQNGFPSIMRFLQKVNEKIV